MIAPGLIKRNLLHRFPLLVRWLDLLCRENRRHSRTNADRRRNYPASGRSGERLYRFWWSRRLWRLWVRLRRLNRCGGLFHFFGRFRYRRRWRLRRHRGRLYGSDRLHGSGNLRFRCLFFDLRFGFGFGFRFDTRRLRLSGYGFGNLGNLDLIRYVNGHDVV
jgi:hypothetical protein